MARLSSKILFLLLTCMVGYILAEQIRLFHYFFEPHFIDQVVLFLLAGVGYQVPHWLRFSFNQRWGYTPFIIFLFALIGFNLNFWLFEMIDWVSFISYFMVILSASAAGIYTRVSLAQVTPHNLLFYIGLLIGMMLPHLSPAILLGTGCIVLLGNQPSPRQGLIWVGLFALLILSHRVVPNSVVYQSQSNYYDKVIFSSETPFQRIDITKWKGNQWFYYNKINQFSSIDYWMYVEPMVHPALEITENPRSLLIIGGENGLIANEILKSSTASVDLLPIDRELVTLAGANEHFRTYNQDVFSSDRVKILDKEVFRYLNANKKRYDIIFIDAPDPIDIETNQYYTTEFYALCYQALDTTGMLITQACSPYYSTRAFYTIDNTVKKAGFSTVLLHNQILSLGEWGWVLASKNHDAVSLKKQVDNCTFESSPTHWLNREAMHMMLAFGKELVKIDTTLVNSLKEPILYELYKNGTWKLE